MQLGSFTKKSPKAKNSFFDKVFILKIEITTLVFGFDNESSKRTCGKSYTRFVERNWNNSCDSPPPAAMRWSKIDAPFIWYQRYFPVISRNILHLPRRRKRERGGEDFTAIQAKEAICNGKRKKGDHIRLTIIFCFCRAAGSQLSLIEYGWDALAELYSITSPLLKKQQITFLPQKKILCKMSSC